MSSDLTDAERGAELEAAFKAEREVWLSPHDLRLIGRHSNLGPGERISSETGEVRYSAAWLNDEAQDAATADEYPGLATAEPGQSLENLKPLGNVDVLKSRRDAPGEGE